MIMRNRNRDMIIQLATADLLYKIQQKSDDCVLKAFCKKDFDTSCCQKEQCFCCICGWLNQEKDSPPPICKVLDD